MRELLASYTRKDFRIDTFRSGGPGGQHQNKTASGVRITHLESGLVAECRETKHQAQNKRIAFRRLSHKIKAWWAEKLGLSAKERRTEGEVIRSFHAVDNRVKDRASGFTQSFSEAVDDLTDMIEARRRAVGGTDQQNP